MEYRYLGTTGVRVSPLCFGTMTFGKEADETESGEIFRACREAGINFFDCADMYQAGRAEEILGRLIKDCRDDVVITTKGFFPTGPGPNAQGASRLHLREAVEASLKRLQTDRVDVYFIHRFDDRTPLAETLRMLDDLVRQGKILYPGLSNFAAWQVEKALGISALHDGARPAVIQPMYNLLKRQAEAEILPMAEAEGLGVIPYSPLAGGFLSGKFGVGRRPDSGRMTENKIYQTRYFENVNFEIADRLDAFARGQGWATASLALAWVGGHPAITAPIFGARNVAQVRSALASLEIPMDAALRAEISAMSPEPPPATDRSEERTDTHFFIRS